MLSVRKYIVAIIGVSVLMITSCKKHTPEVAQSNDPVFSTAGNFDGESFSLVAGDDNAYMFTMLNVENGVNLYSGKLSNGDFSIELGIYDGFVDYQSQVIHSELPEDLLYASSSSNALLVLDRELFANVDMISQVKWIIDGDFVDYNYVEIYEPGIYDVTAEITFTDSTVETLSSELIVGYERHANFQIKHYLNQNGHLSAWVDHGEEAIEKVRWFLDGVPVSDDSQVQMDLTSQSYNLRAEVSFVNSVVRKKTMLVDGSLSGKFIDDLTFLETGILTLQNQDYKLLLKVEKDNQTYWSSYVDNNSNNVELTSVKYYGINDQGEDVYKLCAHVTANVSTTVGGPVHEVEFDTAFGVAIPNE